MRRSLLAMLACLAMLSIRAQSPNTIAGLQLWLDASDPNGNGTTPANGTGLSTWTDKSGNNFNATALTGGSYQLPVFLSSSINGKATVRFNKDPDFVTGYTVSGLDIRAATLPDVTIFTVYKQGIILTGGDQALWGNDDGNWDRFFFSKFGGTNNGAVSQGPANPFLVSIPNAGTVGAVRLLTAVYDGNVVGGTNNGPVNGSAVYFNGQVVSTFTDVTQPTAAQTAFRIGLDGDDNWFGGEIAEMIVYNRKLTTCEIASLNRYLSAKYGQTYNRPVVTVTGNTATCGSTDVLLGAPSAASYQWLMNGAPMAGITTQNLGTHTAGSYQVIVFGAGCATGDTSLAITVTNSAQATLTQPGDQNLCAGTNSAPVAFAGTASSYTWTNNNTATGLAASGTGDIASFAATNATAAPITSTVTVTAVGAGLQGFAYVPNVTGNNVSVINLATGATVATIPTAAEPYAVAITPDRSKVFVSTVSGNRVEVITTATNSINQNSPFNAPHGLVASPDGARVYVNGWTGNAVSYIPTATPTTSTFMVNVTNPEGMAVSPDGTKLYVASSTSPGKLAVINTASNAKTEITLGNFTYGVAISPDGRFVYATNNGSASVSVVDAATLAITTTITVGTNPLGIAVSPDGRTVYVANSGSNTVSVIDAATNTVTATIGSGTFPVGVSFSPDGSRLYVTNRNSNNVSVINTATNAVIATYTAGTNPYGLGNFIAANYTCDGTPKTFNITVNPTPSATLSYSGSPFCASGTATPTLTGTTGGTYSSTAGLSINGTTGVIDLTASTAGTYTVTYGIPAAGGCSGVQATAVVGIRAIAAVNQPGDQTVCTGNPTTAVSFSGMGSAYSWTNSDPSIGLAANGTGNIPSFTATNNGTTPITATITVTPQASGYAYVANYFSNNVSVINKATNTVSATVNVGTFPYAVAVSPDGTRVYVSNFWSNDVSVIDATSNTVIATIPVEAHPHGLAVTPDGSRVYVSSELSSFFSIINTSTNTVEGTVGVAGTRSAAISPDGSRVYMANSSRVAVINSATNTQIASIVAGNSLRDLWVSPDGSRVYVTDYGSNSVSIINAATNSLIGSVAVGSEPWGISGTPDGSRVYVSNYSSNNVSVINTATNTVVQTIGVGVHPNGISVSPDGDQVYVVNQSSTVSVLSTTTNTVVATVGVGNSPNSIGNSVTRSYCAGTSKTFTITVNPQPAATISYSGSPFCATGTATPTFTGTTGGTYSSTPGLSVNSTTGVINLAASTPGDYMVTYALPASGGCGAVQVTTNVTVRPVTQVNQPGNQILCAGITSAPIAFSGTAATYSWTNSNPSIGLGAGGNGAIPAFTPVNNGNVPVTATVTVTPGNTTLGRAYSAGYYANTVSVIDLGTSSVIATIPVGLNPRSTSLSTDGTRLLVTNEGSANVTLINTVTNTVIATVPVHNGPRSVVFSPDGTKAYVTHAGSNFLDVLSLATNTVVATVNLLDPSYGIVTSPDGSKLYVLTEDGLKVVNSTTYAITSVPNTVWANDIAINPAGTRLYISEGALTVRVVDATTNTAITTINVPGTSIRGITVSPDGNRVYLASISTQSIVVIDAQTNTVIDNISVGLSPQGIAITPDGGTGVALNTASSSASVFSTSTNMVTQTIPVGLGAQSFGNFISANVPACPGPAKTFTVTVNPAPAAAVSYAGSPYCAGTGTATPTFSGTPGGTYTAPAGLSINAATGVVDIGASTPGTYTVAYTMAAVPPCAAATATATLTINAPVTAVITPSGPTTICAGGSVTLTAPATPGATYLWSNGATTSSITVSAAGNYSVTVTSNGCVANGGPVTVSVNPTPTVNAIVSQNLCNGANTTAVAFNGSVNGTVFNWTNNTTSIGLAASGTGNIASFAAVNSGTAPVTALVTVTPSYTNGGSTCTGTAASFSITVNPTPTVNTIPDQLLCANATTAAVAFSGTVPNTAYTWTNNNPSIGLAAAGTGDIAPFVALNNGPVPITATITVTPQATLSGRAYVPNNTSGTVSMIDLATGAIVGSPITVGANPFGVTTLPDRSKVYVSNTGGNSVSVINTATNTVTGTSPYNAPHGLVASPDGLRVYVNGWTDNAVSRIDVASNSSTFMTNVTQPEGMAVSADGSRLYVASSTSPGKLVVINAFTNSIVANINVGNFPQGVALSADGSKVYVVNNGSASVSVISTATNTVTATIPVGSNPLGVAVSPDGSKVYVTNSGNDNVSVINTSTNALTASIAVGNYPYGVAVSPDGSTVYVANRNSNSVSIINANTNAVSNVAVGVAPIALGQFTTASLQCAGPPRTFTITVNPKPNAFSVSNQSLCAGASTQAVNLTAGSIAGTTFSWTNDQPSIGLAASGTGDIPSFVAVNTGTTVQTATITVTPSLNGCTGTPVVFTITVRPRPSVDAIPNQTLCAGGSTTAVALTGPVSSTNFVWSNNNTSIGLASGGSGSIPSFVATNTSSTIQTATITITPIASGCIGTTQSFTITVNPIPTVNNIAGQTICNGASTAAVNFSGAVAGTVYSWTNNTPSIGLAASGSGDIASFTAVNNGVAPVVATITATPSFTNGGQTCAGTASSFTITVNPTPTVTSVANQTLCNGAATTAITFAGAVTGTTYSWINSAPSIGLAASGSGNIASFTATNTTAAPVTATISVTPSANSCNGSVQTFAITVNPTPSVVALSPVTVCAGQNITVQNFSGPVSATLYNWSNDNTAIGLAASGTGNIAPFTAVNGGTTPIVANVTVTPTANGCPGTPSTFAITVNARPTGTITAPNGTLICQGSSVLLQASGGTSYQWLLGGSPVGTGATFNATQPGIYTVNITNSFGCTALSSNSITLTLTQKPVANFTFNSYCLNSPVSFTNTTNTTGAGTVTYQWNFGNGQQSTQPSPTITYGTVGSFTVQLVAAPAGCPSLNDTVRKTITIEAPIAGQRLPAQDVVSGRPTEIHARNLSNGHYSWTPATGLSNPAIWYPIATLTQEQEYRIQISFASGCVTMDTLLVRVQKGDDIFVPTAFSPNNDGVNDVLKPITVGLTSLRMFRVFDRMGREVFSSSNFQQGWDGRYRGQPAAADTYTWVAEGWDHNNQLIRKTGQVLLVR